MLLETSIQLQLIPGAIAEIYASTIETGMLTVADRYGLMAAVMDESLAEEERRTVDRLLRGVRQGQIKVVRSLSFLS
ncbi:MAG: hypothetical protein J7647_24360 [Cyanobacteria bacterium SBLK]|nr:hypothetical protein [Cyanobacteria bacterium SBLK]